MWCLCGVGSNIEPEKNVPLALADLVGQFDALWLSPVLRTRPIGIETQSPFLNALVVFTCDLSPRRLKRRLNCLEESLGRDRSDPSSAVKDRTIDVDILAFSVDGHFDDQKVTEPYFRVLLNGGSKLSASVTIDLKGHALGKAPATIHRYLGTSDEFVVDQGEQLNHHALEATLPRQKRL